MGFLDKAKNKAQEFASDNPDKVEKGLDKAGDVANDKTGGKYADKIEKGQDIVSDKLGNGEADAKN
ncbi:antitoxin [Corynebacterium sp. TAE3-ERU12]|uniref:antitoxin n=1 Tax=Corynebacterium sp. TAE3-ERU12 TaxID=2849491 RepID=UPI001C43F988|nr:antitoxin [Corynebacterium sp. TAE3-ERU12]MBV7296093.1 antitoxin [Corynebacterium sp. TAE3-ERU12]